MGELSLTQIPLHGWMFFSAPTNWSMPTPIGQTFDSAVVLIIRHRLANPAVTAKHNLPTDKASVGAELIAFTRARLGMTPVGQPDPPTPGETPRMAKCCGG